MGLISRRFKVSATFGEIISPSLATVVSWITSSFPAFTLVLIPTAANSEIIGPGAKLVGPAFTTMSRGAVWPAFAGASDLFLSISSLRAKGLSLVKSKAGIPLIFTKDNPFALNVLIERNK